MGQEERKVSRRSAGQSTLLDDFHAGFRHDGFRMALHRGNPFPVPTGPVHRSGLAGPVPNSSGLGPVTPVPNSSGLDSVFRSGLAGPVPNSSVLGGRGRLGRNTRLGSDDENDLNVSAPPLSLLG